MKPGVESFLALGSAAYFVLAQRRLGRRLGSQLRHRQARGDLAVVLHLCRVQQVHRRPTEPGCGADPDVGCCGGHPGQHQLQRRLAPGGTSIVPAQRRLEAFVRSHRGTAHDRSDACFFILLGVRGYKAALLLCMSYNTRLEFSNTCQPALTSLLCSVLAGREGHRARPNSSAGPVQPVHRRLLHACGRHRPLLALRLMPRHLRRLPST